MTEEMPLVTVVTPTWQRYKMLLRRCIPSVQAQGYPRVQQVVVSDGPDPELAAQLSMPWLDGWKDLWYRELPVHDEELHWGGPARNAGLELAEGEYRTYCDDDDSLRPDHCYRLAAALDANPEAGFAVSRMLQHGVLGVSVDQSVGHGELALGNVGTPMIMHRREVGGQPVEWGSGPYEDWELVWSWIRAGVPYVRVDADTCDAWPSVWRGAGPDPEPEDPYPHGLIPGQAQAFPDGAERATATDLARPAP
jgi:glycosyltransferase involved in cell wall biosynthesis